MVKVLFILTQISLFRFFQYISDELKGFYGVIFKWYCFVCPIDYFSDTIVVTWFIKSLKQTLVSAHWLWACSRPCACCFICRQMSFAACISEHVAARRTREVTGRSFRRCQSAVLSDEKMSGNYFSSRSSLAVVVKLNIYRYSSWIRVFR